MRRLIDANALMERLKFKRRISERGLHRGLESAMAQVAKAQTVETVEVVRCKDCKHWHHSGYCKKIMMAADRFGNDFCSYGERREGE